MSAGFPLDHTHFPFVKLTAFLSDLEAVSVSLLLFSLCYGLMMKFHKFIPF